jgi:formate dehydrogenase subunit gamma
VAVDEVVYLRRFTRTERALHWIHAAAFFVLLGTGLVLYLPSVAAAVGRRPLVKDIHLYTSLAWAVALVVVVLLGDRPALHATLRDLNEFDDDDRRWLRGRRAPLGRFNALQKLNAAVTAAFAVLLAVSGVLLWYGERDKRFRIDGAIILHDIVTYASVLIVAGHLYLAVFNRSTRHALRGMTIGSVRAEWALVHHRKWAEAQAELGDRGGGDDRRGH